MSATRLVIVESPSKAKKIAGFLGAGWRVIASMGHVRDLPPQALGVDVAHGFAPTYDVVRGKGTVVKKLRAEAKAAGEIYLATDPDREGEAIAWHIREILASLLRGKPVYRVTFHEITRQAVQAAFARPRQLDMSLVDAQQARRVLDRLVGWEVSPTLRYTFGTRGLSAGRVQSVAVRLVVEREQAIERFVPEEYWTLDALLATRGRPPGEFVARLVRLAAAVDKELDPVRLPGARAQAIAAELSAPGLDWYVAGVKQSERHRSPPPPFITSTLQQAGSSKLGMNPKRTMRVAQDLYEGGHITYHRTDSPAVSPEAQQAARAVIADLFGSEALPPKPPFYKARGGNAQEAHECIRPTDPGKLPEAAGLQGDEAKLYKLIWGRFVASQMRPAIYDVTTAEVEVRRGQGVLPYGFRAVGSVLRVPGWLALYGIKPGAMDDEAEEGARQALPALAAQQPLDLRELRPEQHWTQPPPRYSEASLIKALEQHGVGRPSTYATIMETIQARGYVERQGKMLAPTEAGRVVTGFLVERFPDLLDLKFTAQMESDLDRVAEGEVGWTELMARFYGPFHEKVQNARGERRASLAEAVGRRTTEDGGRKGSTPSRRKTVRGKSPGAPPAEVGRNCPNCGKPLVMRRSRYGEFVGCSGYPQCRYLEKTAGGGATEDGGRTTTRGRRRTTDQGQSEAKAPRKGRRVAKGRARAGEASIPTVVDASTPAATTVQVEASNGSPVADPQTCPECGRPLATRNGRYGPFVGCTGYPTCRYTAKPS